MIFKLSLKNISYNKGMNLLIFLQLVIIEIILLSIVSTIFSRFNEYIPFKNEMNSIGYYYDVFYAENAENNIIENTSELESMLKNVKSIKGCYTPFLANSDDCSIIIYDNDIISLYTPEIEDGVWLDNITNEPIIQAVVSQNDENLNVGDTINVEFAFIEDSIPIKIIGILKENTKIISTHDFPRQDYTDLYKVYDYRFEEKPLLLLSISNVDYIENKIITKLSGSLFITYNDDISQNDLDSNNFILNQYINSIQKVNLKDLKNNSIKYIYQQLHNLLPLIISILLMIFICGLSSMAVLNKIQLKNYGIYSLCGLPWNKIININVCSSLILYVISAIVSIIIILFNNIFNLLPIINICIGIPQILLLIVLCMMYIILSLIMPIIITKSNTLVQILKSY